MLYPFVSLLLVLVYLAYLRRSYRGRAGTEYLPAQVRFFEQTGYRVLGREHEPLEAQARAVVLGPVEAMGGLLSPASTPHVPSPWILDLDGDRLIHYPPGSRGGPLDQCGWILALRQATRLRWSLRTRKTLVDRLRPQPEERPRWEPAHPQVKLRDPELAARFEGFADAGTDLDRCLAATGLREALLACDALDLHVLGDRVILYDPHVAFLRSGPGMALGLLLGHARSMEILATTHERIAELLVEVAAASREAV